jgi:ABC-type nickel/cobalt efflux system permease component RcnA
MKRLAVVLAVAVTALVGAGVAAAHPLGNFTTNHYAEVVVSGDRAYVYYVLDLAEIPTFQARSDVESLGRTRYADRLAKTVASGLAVSIDGRTRPLVAGERRLGFPKGAAGLRTTRFELVLAAGTVRPRAEYVVSVRNEVFAERLGWRELVIRADGGATLAQSSAPSRGISDRLLSYPRDRLASPLDVRAAEARFAPGDDVVVPSLDTPSEAAAPRNTTASEGGFAGLIENQELTIGVVALSLLVAMFWGAAHALTPGHGKAIVTAYLVGTRGRPRDALLLGGIVTVTHTIGVFALGFVTLALSEFIVPEDLYPWLNLVSAVLVVLVGLAVFRQRILTALRPAGGVGLQSDTHHDGHHHHGRGHHHHEGMTEEEHARAHLPQEGSGAKGLVAVGISGGLIPCPTALVVLLAAISLHRVAFGLVLIVAFSVGLAAVVSGIGLLAIGARRTFSRMSFDGPLVRALPTVSALVILVVGVAMTARALPGII